MIFFGGFEAEVNSVPPIWGVLGALYVYCL